MRAAQSLKANIIEYTSKAEGNMTAVIMARVYVDLKKLSLQAWKAKLVDSNNQSRALAPFASSFSTMFPFFDLIDVGSEDAVQTKIAGTGCSTSTQTGPNNYRVAQNARKRPAMRTYLRRRWP
jgi:hypothetical protein